MMTLKFKEPHIIRATYRIVTPMFIGDAEQKASGISPASVKGALRFWWRALNWGRCWRDCEGDEVAALKALHEEEARLFGSSMDEQRSKEKKHNGQGCFSLSIEQPRNLKTTGVGSVHNDFKQCTAARYLAYGLMEPFRNNKKDKEAAELDRECIDENQLFTIKLVFRTELDETIIDSLKALGLLGGLGSRARHGMGSVILEKITHKTDNAEEAEIFQAPTTVAVYQEVIQRLLEDKCNATCPPYTAFSQLSRVENLVAGNSPYKTLDNFAEKMLVYRSWGRDGNLNNGLKADRNFQDDHDWYKDPYAQLPEEFHPRRVVFGLPHNYHKDHHHVIPEPDGDSNGEGRRASPLLFHVHRIHEKSYVGISIYLRSTFLPEGKAIIANGTSVPQNIEWIVITDFLDGKDGKQYFPSKQVIVGGTAG